MIDARRLPRAWRSRIARLLRRRQPAQDRPMAPFRHALAALAAPGLEVTEVVLVVRSGGVKLATEVATAFPAAMVQLLTVKPLSSSQKEDLPATVSHRRCPDLPARLRWLASQRRPQLVIERGLERTGDRVGTFRELFGLVTEGGLYVIDSAPTAEAPAEAHQEALRMRQVLTDVVQLAAHATGEHTYEVELGQSIGAVVDLAGGSVIEKRHSHQWKIRDRHANRLLERRFGDGWGEVVAGKPATTLVSRARGVPHGEGLRTLRSEFEVPERWLRRYRDVTCYARKRVRLEDYWLPDTFRNSRMRVLSHRLLHSASPALARVAGEPETPSRELDGPYFYLDSEYFSHFGHVLTDVVGTTWGWQQIKDRVPELRPLVSLPVHQTTLPGFQRQIFASLGIDPATVEVVHPGEPVRVAELYGCTSDWAMPRYCAPELGDVWDRIRTGCQSALTGTPELIFIGRRARDIRTCLNADEVESFFTRLGFTVLYPEDLDFGDQIATFAGARVIAGFAGSGMFSAMFAPSATVLVLTGDSYTALNEYLIKSVVGGDIHYFWTPALLRHPPGRWTWEAFRSNFVFDLERFGPEIQDVVASLT